MFMQQMAFEVNLLAWRVWSSAHEEIEPFLFRIDSKSGFSSGQSHKKRESVMRRR
jgi:hypothetical protein